MTATLAVEVGRLDDVLRVPVAALRFTPTADVLRAYAGSLVASEAGSEKKGASVWQLDNGVLEPRVVRTGLSDGVLAAVIDGPLVDGAQVVTGVPSMPGAAPAARSSGSPLVPSMPGPRGQRR
jgi:HlyD family secretion protein